MVLCAERFIHDAGDFWEKFYRQHRESFFKDRHYLEREFPALAEGAPHILEVVPATLLRLLGLPSPTLEHSVSSEQPSSHMDKSWADNHTQ